MASITFTGVSSGVDFSAIVDGLMYAERASVRRLETRKAVWENRNEALGKIESELSALATAVGDMARRSNLVESSATSSDEDVLTAVANTDAAAGSYSIQVNQLAVAEREIHDGTESRETLVGAGVLAYTYGTTTITVTTDATTTLEDLAELINNDAANPGVRASILEYDSGDGKAYHLVLAGEDTGADNTIAIDDVQTTLDGTNGTVDFRSVTFTEGQAAQNAQVRVDGYPKNDWIERSSNTVTDVIDGLAINLQGAGTASITVSSDTESLKETIQAMVTAYNDVIGAIKEETEYDADTGEAGVLLGDYSVRMIRDSLQQWIIGSAAGFEGGSDAFTLPGQIGLELDGDGMLSLDEETLDAALGEDLDAVIELVTSNLTGASDSAYITYYASSATLTQPGIYEVEADFDGGGTLIAGRIRLAGEGAWRDADVEGSYLVGVSGNAEDSLRIRAMWDGASSTQSAQVRVRRGFAASIEDELDDILDSYEGPIKLSKDGYQATIDNIEENIEREEARMKLIEERLTQRFSRLETLLARLQGLTASLGTQFASYMS